MKKTVYFGDDARDKLKKGVDLIANAVKVTLGPRGFNFIYSFHYGYPVATKDGVTVARQVDARDAAEQMGLMLIRQVAQKTADDAGDGTTTATILAQEIFTKGLKSLKSGANPILVKRGIDRAVTEVLTFIDTMKMPISGDEDLFKVAALSANNDAFIGQLICEAVKKVGNDGVITIEDNYQGSDCKVETIEGMQLNEGLLSAYLVTDPVKMEATYRDAWLLIIDEELHQINQVKGILEKAISSQKPVVLIANDIHPAVLQTLVQSRLKNNVPIVAIKSPYFGDFRTEQLTDLAVLTGGRVIGYTTGLKLEEAELVDLGRCESVRSNRHKTTILGGQGNSEAIAGRVEMIKATIATAESDYQRQKLQERLSKLTTGVAVIKVGAPTEVEQKEKKMRVEDALLATRAAIEDGIVPGGGLTLLRAEEAIKEHAGSTPEENIGSLLLKESLRAPIKQIAINSGMNGSEIIAQINSLSANKPELWFGFNFLTLQFGHLLELGVIDPAKVVKASLINAASVAGLLLTTEVVCTEDEEVEATRTPLPRSA